MRPSALVASAPTKDNTSNSGDLRTHPGEALGLLNQVGNAENREAPDVSPGAFSGTNIDGPVLVELARELPQRQWPR